DLVVLRHHVDGVERDRGRTAQRTGGLDPPYLGTGLRVERDHVAGAVRRIDPAIGEADAAAEGRIPEVAFHLDPVLPAARAGGCVERVNVARGIDHEQRTGTDDRRG